MAQREETSHRKITGSVTVPIPTGEAERSHAGF